jgi:hypothetical protein
MLSEILSHETCGNCQICCSFTREDVWETPLFFEETKQILKERFSKVMVKPAGKEAYTFSMEFPEEEEIIFCPVLDRHTGCKLGEDKPFDCKIWPFRIMKQEDKLVITIAALCPALGNKDIQKLQAFLNKGLGNRIFEEAKKHPAMIKPYETGYPVVISSDN